MSWLPDVIDFFRATCIRRNNISVDTKVEIMADHKNQNNSNNQTAPNKSNPPMTEQQKQAAEAERTNRAPGSQEKQPGAPRTDSDKK